MPVEELKSHMPQKKSFFILELHTQNDSKSEKSLVRIIEFDIK